MGFQARPLDGRLPLVFGPGSLIAPLDARDWGQGQLKSEWWPTYTGSLDHSTSRHGSEQGLCPLLWLGLRPETDSHRPHELQVFLYIWHRIKLTIIRRLH